MYTCMMCGITAKLKHFDIYIIGSEGLDICKSCEMEVVEFVREKRREYGIRRKEKFKREKIYRHIAKLVHKGRRNK